MSAQQLNPITSLAKFFEHQSALKVLMGVLQEVQALGTKHPQVREIQANGYQDAMAYFLRPRETAAIHVVLSYYPDRYSNIIGQSGWPSQLGHIDISPSQHTGLPPAPTGEKCVLLVPRTFMFGQEIEKLATAIGNGNSAITIIAEGLSSALGIAKQTVEGQTTSAAEIIRRSTLSVDEQQAWAAWDAKEEAERKQEEERARREAELKEAAKLEWIRQETVRNRVAREARDDEAKRQASESRLSALEQQIAQLQAQAAAERAAANKATLPSAPGGVSTSTATMIGSGSLESETAEGETAK